MRRGKTRTLDLFPYASAMAEFFDLLFAGPKFWIGMALGLVGAWLAWTFLPTSFDRASIAALVLLAGLILGGVWSYVSEKRM